MTLRQAGSARPGGATLLQVIDSHQNNYTWIRLLLSSSIIYYHSFALTQQSAYVDHLTAVLWPVTTVGGLAVQCFFFLSGLFVAQSYFRDSRFLHFVAKRTLRIWPGLFVCLLVTALLAVLVARPGDWIKFLLFQDFYSYILSNSVFEFKWTLAGVFADNKSAVMNGAIHTLPLEAKMYVILGCLGLAGLLKTARRTVLAALVLLVLCFVPNTLDLLPLHLFNADYSRTAICMFLGGVAVFGAAQWIVARWWQGVLLGTLLALGPAWAHVLSFYVFVSWALLFVGQNKWIAKLGYPGQDLSYGIYLYGWPSQQLVMAWLPGLNPYQLMACALALASGLAFLSWHGVEKPAIRLGKQLSLLKFDREWRMTLPGASVRFAALLVAVVVVCLAMLRLTQSHDFLPVGVMSVSIQSFGPTESVAGQAINEQPDGESALWIKTQGTAPPGTVIVFDGVRLVSSVQADLVTAKVPKSLLASAGDKRIFLEFQNTERIERSNPVVLRILAR